MPERVPEVERPAVGAGRAELNLGRLDGRRAAIEVIRGRTRPGLVTGDEIGLATVAPRELLDAGAVGGLNRHRARERAAACAICMSGIDLPATTRLEVVVQRSAVRRVWVGSSIRTVRLLCEEEN